MKTAGQFPSISQKLYITRPTANMPQKQSASTMVAPWGTPRQENHHCTPGQIRFIMVLRQVGTDNVCWTSIAACFNHAFGTNVSAGSIHIQWLAASKRRVHGQILHKENTHHEGYKTGNERYSLKESTDLGMKSHCFKSEERFIISLEHVSANRCHSRDRWFAIAACFNEVFAKDISDGRAYSRYLKYRRQNGPLIRSLKENGTVPERFRQEHLEVLQFFLANKRSCFVDGIKSRFLYNRFQPKINNVEPRDELKLVYRPATADERQFLILMEYFTHKSWDGITNCFNQEFGNRGTKTRLLDQWNMDRLSHPLSKILKEQVVLPTEVVEKVRRLLNKYGDSLTCDESHVEGHTGFGLVRPCTGPHTTSHNVCEDCNTSALCYQRWFGVDQGEGSLLRFVMKA